MTKTIRIICAMIIVLSVATLAFAAQTNTITVKATVPTLQGMDVAISKVVGTTWTKLTSNTLMDFGSLTYSSTLGIFTAASYFAVDVGVLNNSGSWSIQHTPSSIYNNTTGITTQKLDGNINVTFAKEVYVTESTSTETLITGGRQSFATSSKAITNSTIPVGSWLRIYYGIGTGATDTTTVNGDNPGVTPIVAGQVAGTYQGSVTLTLTP